MERKNIKYKIAVLIGKTGSGKDSIFKALKETDKIKKVISTTTRPRRLYEENDIDYHFIDDYDFVLLDNQDKFLDTSFFNDWRYGTNIDDLDETKINIIISDSHRLIDLLINTEVDVIIFFIEATGKERLLRCLNREEDPDADEIVRRYIADEEDFGTKEFQLVNRYVRPTVIIPNHDGEMEQAVTQIQTILDNWAD